MVLDKSTALIALLPSKSPWCGQMHPVARQLAVTVQVAYPAQVAMPAQVNCGLQVAVP